MLVWWEVWKSPQWLSRETQSQLMDWNHDYGYCGCCGSEWRGNEPEQRIPSEAGTGSLHSAVWKSYWSLLQCPPLAQHITHHTTLYGSFSGNAAICVIYYWFNSKLDLTIDSSNLIKKVYNESEDGQITLSHELIIVQLEKKQSS